MIGVRIGQPVGMRLRVSTGAGELDLVVISSFQLPQLNVELPPLAQFRLTTHNCGMQQMSAAGPGNALQVANNQIAPQTFFSINDSTAGTLLFQMPGGDG
jgi:hypothetical protein